MIHEILAKLGSNLFFEILLIAVVLDTGLGVLRAIKEHKFNSSVGIDGAIRKVAMLFSVGLLMLVDMIMNINILFMIPKEYIQYLGIEKLGMCELFCLLFILYEAVSILKNMTLCGLPVPKKAKTFILKFLDDMTDELPRTVKEKIHKTAIDDYTYNQTHGAEGE